eukprot:gnl/Hemi2/6895_TR2350_c0_g1_i1.p1 gnl/Hemi2/6895_TR2350_c0_g1~~gnl/Hemi2/6895_TR2350_c0_g1_i1.p1  ORF type:complete len:209 (-),score=56.72 gnl/Hemi2/6895_TR2350_c0_g1_i1:91-717(-)
MVSLADCVKSMSVVPTTFPNGSSAAHHCDVLLVGCEGAGKSLLTKRLMNLKAAPPGTQVAYTTFPTVGVELDEVHGEKASVLVREVGGVFVNLWANYFGGCQMVVFVVDASNSAQLAAAYVELLNILRAEALASKPLLLLLNKTDHPHALSLQALSVIFRLDDLIAACGTTRPVSVLEASAFTGANLPKVWQWAVDAKAQAAKPKAKP